MKRVKKELKIQYNETTKKRYRKTKNKRQNKVYIK